jgi:hypothetical protein
LILGLFHSWPDPEPTSWGVPATVDLIDPHDPLDEIVTTLLYRVSHAPYRSLLAAVRTWTEKQKQEAIDVAKQHFVLFDETIRLRAALKLCQEAHP